MTIKTIIHACLLLCVILMGLPASHCFGADKLDPFNAEFRLISGTSDVKVTLDFAIHNDEDRALAGSKFICNEEIESVSVADTAGNKLPFTIKLYPRKRIIWQYPMPEDGKRHIIIRFVMKDAVQQQNDGTYALTIDWISWNRDVLNANISFLFPADKSDLILTSALLPDYRVVSAREGARVSYSFPKLTADMIGFEFHYGKQPAAPEKKRTVAPEPVTEKPSPTDEYRIKDIRISTTETHDRLVFDLNRRIPLSVEQGEQQVIISWDHPVTVSEKLLQKKVLKGSFINSVQWRRQPDNRLSCILNINIPDYRIRYNHLDAPERLYMDVLRDEEQPSPKPDIAADPPTVVQQLPEPEKDTEKKPAIPAPPLKEQLPWLMKEAPELFVSDRPPAQPPEDKAPIQESIALTRAKGVMEAGDYENAIKAFDAILERFPQTVLEEEILFLKADAYYRLIEEDIPETLQNAARAYKNAVERYPGSPRSEQAHYRIAQCYKKLGFYTEAISQFGFFTTTYPDSNLLPSARFHTAEAHYQMKRYDRALELFERFTFDFPQDPNIKMATFRIGDCYFKLNEFDKAEYYYEKAIRTWPDLSLLPPDTLNNMAINNYFKGKFTRSREIAFLSFNLYPGQEENALLLRFIGDAYQWDGFMQNALNIYRNIIEMFPESSERFYAVMRIADIGVNVDGLEAKDLRFEQFNPYRDPEQAYRWIVSAEPSRPLLTEAYYKLGFLKAKQAQYAEAIAFFKKAMQDRERTLYYKRSFENIQKIVTSLIAERTARGDYFGAIKAYETNFDPFLKDIENLDISFNAGISFLELGFLNRAEALFKTIIDRTDVSELRHRATVASARVALQRGNFATAEDILKILLFGEEQISPSVQQQAYHILGDAVYRQGKFNEAKNFYTTALQWQDDSPRAVKSLFRAADAMAKTGYTFNAVQLLRRVLETAREITPETDEIRSIRNNAGMLLAELLVKSGEFAAADQVFRQVAEQTDDAATKGWALLKRALALSEAEEYEKASTVFTKISEQAPDVFFSTLSEAMRESMMMERTLQEEAREFM